MDEKNLVEAKLKLIDAEYDNIKQIKKDLNELMEEKKNLEKENEKLRRNSKIIEERNFNLDLRVEELEQLNRMGLHNITKIDYEREIDR